MNASCLLGEHIKQTMFKDMIKCQRLLKSNQKKYKNQSQSKSKSKKISNLQKYLCFGNITIVGNKNSHQRQLSSRPKTATRMDFSAERYTNKFETQINDFDCRKSGHLSINNNNNIKDKINNEQLSENSENMRYTKISSNKIIQFLNKQKRRSVKLQQNPFHKIQRAQTPNAKSTRNQSPQSIQYNSKLQCDINNQEKNLFSNPSGQYDKLKQYFQTKYLKRNICSSQNKNSKRQTNEPKVIKKQMRKSLEVKGSNLHKKQNSGVTGWSMMKQFPNKMDKL